MKKLFLLLFMLIGHLSEAQIKFGLEAGLNISNVFGPDMNVNKSVAGLQAGGIASIQVSHRWTFQPGVLYSAKGYGESIPSLNISDYRMVTLNYLELPLTMKYSVGSFFAIAGPYVSYAVAGKLHTPSTNGSSSANLFKKEQGSEQTYVKRYDWGAMAGIGFRFAHGLYIQAMYSRGIANIANEVYTPFQNLSRTFSVGYLFPSKAKTTANGHPKTAN